MRDSLFSKTIVQNFFHNNQYLMNYAQGEYRKAEWSSCKCILL